MQSKNPDVLALTRDTESSCNMLAQQILSAKYYAANEVCPEDVFYRVAKAVAIPDVVDFFFDKSKKKVPNDFVSQFGSFSTICERVLKRRGLTLSETTLADWKMPGMKFSVKERWADDTKKYFHAMASLRLMPGTPTLINGGMPNGMLSSCFFLRVPDSLEGIMNTNTQVALISKAGGGVGLDISELRPKDSAVGTTANGKSSGPVSLTKFSKVVFAGRH